jgi:hypothetical protein
MQVYLAPVAEKLPDTKFISTNDLVADGFTKTLVVKDLDEFKRLRFRLRKGVKLCNTNVYISPAQKKGTVPTLIIAQLVPLAVRHYRSWWC